MLRAFLIATVLTCALTARSARAETCSTSSCFEKYIEDNLCTSDQDSECLFRRTAHACANNGCPRNGYGWRIDGDDPAHLHIHELLEFLKGLRNVAFGEPTKVLENDSHGNPLSFGLSLQDLMWHQIQMMLLDPSMTYYDQNLVPVRGVTSARYGANWVDPTLFYVVAWNSGEWDSQHDLDLCPGSNPPADNYCKYTGGSVRKAHSMTQADLGWWLVDVAKHWTLAKKAENAPYLLLLAERVYNAYGARSADGGVRNDKRGYTCYNGHYCYWFMGREGDPVQPDRAVLNKNIYAIRDAEQSYVTLKTLKNNDGTPLALPSPGFANNLYEWVRGGLFNLAFGPGNTSSTADTPPNLSQFVSLSSSGFLEAFYTFDMQTHVGLPITAERTCHYDFLSLDLMATVLRDLSNPLFSSDQELQAASSRLLSATGTVPQCPSTSPTGLHQLWNGINSNAAWLNDCTDTPSATSETFYDQAFHCP